MDELVSRSWRHLLQKRAGSSSPTPDKMVASRKCFLHAWGQCRHMAQVLFFDTRRVSQASLASCFEPFSALCCEPCSELRPNLCLGLLHRAILSGLVDRFGDSKVTVRGACTKVMGGAACYVYIMYCKRVG